MHRGTSGLMPALRDTQQDDVVCWCCRCGGEVYADETMYVWEGKRICSDCFRGVVKSRVEMAPTEVAFALDVDTVTV